MNRREILAAAIAAPILSMPLAALASTRRIVWEPGALTHPQAQVVAESLNQILDEPVLYSKSDVHGFGHAIKLTDPKFVVRRGGLIWNWMTGLTDEEGLLITGYERGVDLGETGLFTSVGYAGYWRGSMAVPRDPLRHPDYGVRAFVHPYEPRAATPGHPRRVTSQTIEKALGRDAIGVDMRWAQEWAASEASRRRATALETAA